MPKNATPTFARPLDSYKLLTPPTVVVGLDSRTALAVPDMLAGLDVTPPAEVVAAFDSYADACEAARALDATPAVTYADPANPTDDEVMAGLIAERRATLVHQRAAVLSGSIGATVRAHASAIVTAARPAFEDAVDTLRDLARTISPGDTIDSLVRAGRGDEATDAYQRGTHALATLATINLFREVVTQQDMSRSTYAAYWWTREGWTTTRTGDDYIAREVSLTAEVSWESLTTWLEAIQDGATFWTPTTDDIRQHLEHLDEQERAALAAERAAEGAKMRRAYGFTA